MEYALIQGGKVANIIVLHPMNRFDFMEAVPTDGVPVQVGDEYVDGKFYRNGEEVFSPSSITEAQIAAIKDMAVAEIEEAVLNGTDE